MECLSDLDIIYELPVEEIIAHKEDETFDRTESGQDVIG